MPFASNWLEQEITSIPSSSTGVTSPGSLTPSEFRSFQIANPLSSAPLNTPSPLSSSADNASYPFGQKIQNVTFPNICNADSTQPVLSGSNTSHPALGVIQAHFRLNPLPSKSTATLAVSSTNPPNSAL